MNAHRFGIIIACAVASTPLLTGIHAADDKLVTLTGKVVPLADLVEKSGSKLDADAAPFSLALVTDDGKVYPLVKDGGSRMFFKDAALLNRPMQLTGKLLPNSSDIARGGGPQRQERRASRGLLLVRNLLHQAKREGHLRMLRRPDGAAGGAGKEISSLPSGWRASHLSGGSLSKLTPPANAGGSLHKNELTSSVRNRRSASCTDGPQQHQQPNLRLVVAVDRCQVIRVRRLHSLDGLEDGVKDFGVRGTRHHQAKPLFT